MAKTARRKQMASIRKTSIQQAVKGPTFIEDFLRYLRGMPVVSGINLCGEVRQTLFVLLKLSADVGIEYKYKARGGTKAITGNFRL